MQWRWLLLAGSLLAAVISAAVFLPPAVDWRYVWRPGALALAAGQSPYVTVDYFSAPPWVPLAFIPLTWFPENVSRGILFVAGLLAYGWAAHRLGAKPVTLLLFLASPMVMHSLLNANLDWMVLLGFVLPPSVGLLLVAVKPQIGFGVALFWLVEAWRGGGTRAVARMVWPVTLAYLISFAIFGFWPRNYFSVAEYSAAWNASLWPATLPVGAALLAAALRNRNAKYAMAAAPCLSPYVLFHSWSAALIAIVSAPAEMLAAFAGLWAWVILRAAQVF
jgi:hypothetical protein